MEFLRVLDASTGVQGTHVLLFAENCDMHPQDTSFLRTIKFVYYPPNCISIMPSMRLGYG
jgi:hypothetical protein